VSHPLVARLPERNPPTLWPPFSKDASPMEIAVEACKQEREVLKNLAVELSEIISRNLIGEK
jgi:hypothetical protein